MDFIRLNPPQGVGANSRATLVTEQLLGLSLHALVFKRGGGAFTDAHFSGIRARIDGKDVVNPISGAKLVDLNEYDGIATVANHTALFFGDPTARTIRGQHLGDIDFSIYQKPLELEWDIGAATTPTLECWAWVGVPKLQMGVDFKPIEAAHMRALVRTTIQTSAAVNRQAFGIGLGSSPGNRWRKAAFFHGGGLSKVELKKQSITKWDDVASDTNTALQAYYGRTAQTNLYMLDRMMDGNSGEAETTVRDDGTVWNTQLAITTSGAETIEVYSELYATLPNL